MGSGRLLAPQPIHENLLPADGQVIYYGTVFDNNESDLLFQHFLHHIPWQHDRAMIYGNLVVTGRQTAWFGDKAFQYTYSRITRTALPWTEELLRVRTVVQRILSTTFNSCLMNLYEDGSQGVGWHSDDERELGSEPVIASVSFGAERRFDLKHKTSKQKISVFLPHGSLLLMGGKTQKYWVHQIAKSKKVETARINLTFRQMAG